jgi:hypothetical protein
MPSAPTMGIDIHLPVRRSGNTRQVDDASSSSSEEEEEEEEEEERGMGDLEEDLENLAPIQLQGRGFAK